MDFYNFLVLWFSKDLATLGTLLISVVVLIIFIIDVSSKVKLKQYKNAIWLFCAYLVTFIGLLLILFQSLKNIQ